MASPRIAVVSALLSAVACATASCWYGVEEVAQVEVEAGAPAPGGGGAGGALSLDASHDSGCAADERCVILPSGDADDVLVLNVPGEFCPADIELTHCNIGSCSCDPENNGHCESRLATEVADAAPGACGTYGGWTQGEVPCRTLLESRFARAESKEFNGFKCIPKGSAQPVTKQYCTRVATRCKTPENGICVPFKTGPKLMFETGHSCPAGYSPEYVRDGPTDSCGCACGKCKGKGYLLYEDDVCSVGAVWLEADGVCRELTQPVRAYRGPFGGKCHPEPAFQPSADKMLCVPRSS